MRVRLAAWIALSTNVAIAADAPKFDPAAAFGARPDYENVTLSPDGTSIAFIAPKKGQGSTLTTLRLDDKNLKAIPALTVSGDPERLENCQWIANDRLACTIFGVIRGAGSVSDLLPASRVFAVNADGSNRRQLSTSTNEYSRGYLLYGGGIIDLMPDKDGVVLMARQYVPDSHTGSRLGTDAAGLGVDLIDTRTAHVEVEESAYSQAGGYISDGRGRIRIMAERIRPSSSGQDRPVTRFLYRLPDSRTWQKLSEYDVRDRTGFIPDAVDPDMNVAYGTKRLDGRNAIYTVSLDGSLHEQLVYSRPDVDVDDLIYIGRRHRVVGVSYVTDLRHAHYFDPTLEALVASVSKALPNHPGVRIIDSSVDEQLMLLFVSRDNEPGNYYLFNRSNYQLRPLVTVREPLEEVKLAVVKSIKYPASDGTMIPGYLTLPPGMDEAKGLPSIVMPHGGPAARDVWGFNWLAQFYAAEGFAVLQPNFRGSAGYGDAWYLQNGFRSWPTAVGDVLDAGRWLVAQGIADPHKLATVGWSYGGYAALQAAVVDPSVFKAVVAIAPVTDLNDQKEEWRHFSNYTLMSDYIGEGPQLREGSPAENADKIKVPVLLFHGAMDRNVSIRESEHMMKSLQSAHVPVELVTWDKLDHQLDDSDARAQMLRKSETFLRQTLGSAPDISPLNGAGDKN